MSKTLSHRQIAKKGGESTLRKHGQEKMMEWAKKGGETVRDTKDRAFFARNGIKGNITKYTRMLKAGKLTQEQYRQKIDRMQQLLNSLDNT